MRIKERKTSKNKNPNHEKRNEGKYKQRQKPLEEKSKEILKNPQSQITQTTLRNAAYH